MIFLRKFHWTCSRAWMSPFWDGFHSWQHYSSLDCTRDFQSVIIGAWSLVWKVLGIQLHCSLAASVMFLMCVLNVPSLLMVMPRSQNLAWLYDIYAHKWTGLLELCSPIIHVLHGYLHDSLVPLNDFSFSIEFGNDCGKCNMFNSLNRVIRLNRFFIKIKFQ